VSSVFVRGCGAVSPAGWGVEPFLQALRKGEPLPAKDLFRPGWEKPFRVRTAGLPGPRPSFLGHSRLRRSSPIAQSAVGAALEALGSDFMNGGPAPQRMGIVFCVMSGCVNYSRRFYDEVLKEPATASPLVFPETVFNAPSSHLASVLGSTGLNYTLVGDSAGFLVGLALGANWLREGRVDSCLVIGAEEMDWLTADAANLFDRRITVSDGAGALYLKREPGDARKAELRAVTQPFLFTLRQSRCEAARRASKELRAIGETEFLVDGLQTVSRIDAAEEEAWRDWKGPRLSPKKVFGEGLVAATAWQCLAAIDIIATRTHRSADVSIVGCNQQAIGARFAAV
jgi:hypothetical protein